MTTILQDAGPGWVVLGVATLALLAVPILRRLLPRGRRHRGGGAVLFLGASVVLSASAILLGGMAGASLGTLVQVVSVLMLGIGLVAIAGLVVFDLVLTRVGVDVPSILRDLLLVSVAVALVTKDGDTVFVPNSELVAGEVINFSRP